MTTSMIPTTKRRAITIAAPIPPATASIGIGEPVSKTWHEMEVNAAFYNNQVSH